MHELIEKLEKLIRENENLRQSNQELQSELVRYRSFDSDCDIEEYKDLICRANAGDFHSTQLLREKLKMDFPGKLVGAVRLLTNLSGMTLKQGRDFIEGYSDVIVVQ